MILTPRDFSFIALMAALTVTMATIPALNLPFLPVPITVQTLGVMLAGALLGAKRGGLALSLFLLLMVIGLPVLSGFVGGAGVLLTPSGGFLLAWPLSAFAIGFLVEKNWRRLNFVILFLIIFITSTVTMYGIGIPWMAKTMSIPIQHAALLSVVFIPGDCVKAMIAAWIALVFKKYYPLIDEKNRY